MAQHTKEQRKIREKMQPPPFPYTVTARLKVETLDKHIQVELPSLFNPREASDGKIIQPRRISTRGRSRGSVESATKKQTLASAPIRLGS